MSISRRRFAHVVAIALAAGLPRRAWAQTQGKAPKSADASAGAIRIAPKPAPRLGINLGGPADYNEEIPFLDVFRISRPWVSQRQGANFGEGPKLSLDRNGWVRKLAPTCSAETFLCTIPSVPAGEWTVLYEGKGQIEMWGEPLESQRSVGPGRHVFTTKRGVGSGFVLRLLKTDPANYVRNIQVLMPGVDPEKVKRDPWNPTFLARWKGMACVRFMDLLCTNNSQLRRWADRPRLDHATFSERGVPVELLVDLANRLHIDPWFCIPHQADDDYVRQFARLVKRKLSPDLRAHVE